MAIPSRPARTLSLHMRVTIPEGVLSQPLDDETVVLHLGTGTYFGLDAVGTRIWQLLQARRSLQEIHAALCEEYAVDADTLSSDLLKFLQHLEEQRLIQHA